MGNQKAEHRAQSVNRQPGRCRRTSWSPNDHVLGKLGHGGRGRGEAKSGKRRKIYKQRNGYYFKVHVLVYLRAFFSAPSLFESDEESLPGEYGDGGTSFPSLLRWNFVGVSIARDNTKLYIFFAMVRFLFFFGVFLNSSLCRHLYFFHQLFDHHSRERPL